MYQNIKSCVTLNGIRSNFFNSYIGVRQGENLSPMLFAIYVNDLEQYLTDKGCEHLHFGDQELSNFLKLVVLMYADDTILLADSAKDLQHSLDSLNDYCKLWKLQVNESKTKIMVFSKRKCKTRPQFTYDGKLLEMVDNFKYLGVLFSCNGKFTECKKQLYLQAQ